MNALATIKRLNGILEKITKNFGWLGPLLVRVTVGLVFIGTGWGKIHDLDKVAAFFTELHIPAPTFQAALVATTELVGGTLVLIGLGTRFAAAPLAFTMVIALLTAKRAEIDSVDTLVGFVEFAYLAMFVWLTVAGAGPVSIDRLITRRLKGPERPRPLLAPPVVAPVAAQS